MTIELPRETRQQAIASIERYFEDQCAQGADLPGCRTTGKIDTPLGADGAEPEPPQP